MNDRKQPCRDSRHPNRFRSLTLSRTLFLLCPVLLLGLGWAELAFAETEQTSSTSPQENPYLLPQEVPEDLFDHDASAFGAWNIEIVTPPPIRGENISRENMTPVDSFARVELIKKELDLIRVEMGKPKIHHSPLQVSQASPFEVYFQAQTLYEKSDRLAFEHTGTLEKRLGKVSHSAIGPGDVWTVVDSALLRIRVVKNALGITNTVQETLPTRSLEPSDVFQAIVEINRQLNVLLDRQFAPRDVFAQVTMAIHYSSTLLAQFPHSKRIPQPLLLERGKTPEQVYHRLSECVSRLGALAAQSGLTLLKLEARDRSPSLIEPSDVYDLASLLVAQLAYVHSQLPGARMPIPTFDPGRKFPSHVYQRAGILLAQIHQLAQHVQTNSKWLEG